MNSDEQKLDAKKYFLAFRKYELFASSEMVSSIFAFHCNHCPRFASSVAFYKTHPAFVLDLLNFIKFTGFLTECLEGTNF